MPPCFTAPGMILFVACCVIVLLDSPLSSTTAFVLILGFFMQGRLALSEKSEALF
jgi:hypothetical protein